MNLPTRLTPLSCLALACSLGPQPGAGDSSSTGTPTTTTTSITTGTPGTGAPVTGSDTSTAEPTSTSIAATTFPEQTGFIPQPDGGDDFFPCDPRAQDCKPGEKCTWWAHDGGNAWNATRCVPIAEDPRQAGDPCTAPGRGISGEDDCDIGLMCWDVDADDSGTCIAFCMGSDDSPTCPPGYACVGGRDGGPMVCLPTCDPLAQDCPGDDLCLPVSDTFMCLLDASGDAGQLHDPCEYVNTCDKGLICLGPSAAVECDQAAQGCCEPMCDLTNPDPCPGAGQTCQPVHEPQPQGYEHVGYCSVPQ